MAYVMFQFRSPEAVSLGEVAKRYGISVGDLDLEYGVIPTDEADGLYVVMVEEVATEKVEAALKARGEDGDPAVGVFSNPKVEGFGDFH